MLEVVQNSTRAKTSRTPDCGTVDPFWKTDLVDPGWTPHGDATSVLRARGGTTRQSAFRTGHDVPHAEAPPTR